MRRPEFAFPTETRGSAECLLARPRSPSSVPQLAPRSAQMTVSRSLACEHRDIRGAGEDTRQGLRSGIAHEYGNRDAPRYGPSRVLSGPCLKHYVTCSAGGPERERQTLPLVHQAAALPSRCACQRRWSSIKVEMKKVRVIVAFAHPQCKRNAGSSAGNFQQRRFELGVQELVCGALIDKQFRQSRAILN